MVAYPSFRKCECTLTSKVIKILIIKTRNYTIREEKVATLISSIGLADVCDGTSTFRISCSRVIVVNPKEQ